jgi:hypothetical protein
MPPAFGGLPSSCEALLALQNGGGGAGRGGWSPDFLPTPEKLRLSVFGQLRVL